MLNTYLFYFLSFVSVFTALLVLFSKNPVHSVLYLVICFFSIAGHYILLNAQFLAAVHIIVYAGAIMVLFLFVIMLLNLNKESEPHKSNWLKFAAVIAGGIIFILLIASAKDAQLIYQNSPQNAAEIGLVKNLGKVLFSKFLLPFEISAILFLSAMVGAVMLGKKQNG